MKSRDLYRRAGVDIELADRLIARHMGPGINAGDSSRIQVHPGAETANFGALSKETWSSTRRFEDDTSPSHKREEDKERWRFVMTSDGVGSKVLLATDAWHHRAIAQDCVAMCTNDLRAMGASPMWFMDYFSSNTLREEVFSEVARGLHDATQREGCLLMGGETAEMPGFYAHDQYELVGFAVGKVRSGSEWTGAVRPGDWVIALASNGLHSNGFSLVRRAIEEGALSLEDELEDGQLVRDHVMRPTTLYGAMVERLLREGGERMIRRGAHVTGGGLVRARQRLCGEANLGVDVLDRGEEPLIVSHVREVMGMSREEAEGVWNAGVGFLMAVDRDAVPERAQLEEILKRSALPCWLYGEVSSQAACMSEETR